VPDAERDGDSVPLTDGDAEREPDDDGVTVLLRGVPDGEKDGEPLAVCEAGSERVPVA